MPADRQKFMARPSSDRRPASDLAVYGISVAAELVGSAPQNLRLYEARGLVNPARSDGGTRRYSEDDLERLREIAHLLDRGLNLAGVVMVLALQDANQALQAQLDGATTDAGQCDAPSGVSQQGLV
jgi:MerR family transcriptional regulator/heat shock protein HspR